VERRPEKRFGILLTQRDWTSPRPPDVCQDFKMLVYGALTEGVVVAVRRVRYSLRRGFQELKVPASEGRRYKQNAGGHDLLHVKD
jgi:hypothetical protein